MWGPPGICSVYSKECNLGVTVQSMGRHGLDGIDPVALLLFTEISILSINFLYYHDGKIFQRVMRLVEVLSYWSIQSSMVYVGPVPR